jgi:hypothetical protein
MKTELEKYAQRTGTIASLIGLVVGFIMVGFIFEGYDWLAEEGFMAYSAFGCFIMVISARWISGKNAPLKNRNVFVKIMAGAGSALLSILIASLSGSILYVVIHIAEIGLKEFWIYLLAPLFWIGLFGSLPAAIIGGIWGAIVHSK